MDSSSSKTPRTRGPRKSLAEKAVGEYLAAKKRSDKKDEAAARAAKEADRLGVEADEAQTETDFWASHPAVQEYLGETDEFEKEGTSDGDDA